MREEERIYVPCTHRSLTDWCVGENRSSLTANSMVVNLPFVMIVPFPTTSQEYWAVLDVHVKRQPIWIMYSRFQRKIPELRYVSYAMPYAAFSFQYACPKHQPSHPCEAHACAYMFFFSLFEFSRTMEHKEFGNTCRLFKGIQKINNFSDIGINEVEPKRQTWNRAAGAKNDFPKPSPVKCTTHHLHGTSGLRSGSHSIKAAHITGICPLFVIILVLFSHASHMLHTIEKMWRRQRTLQPMTFYARKKRSCYWSNDYTRLLHAPLSTTQRHIVFFFFRLVPCILHTTQYRFGRRCSHIFIKTHSPRKNTYLKYFSAIFRS